MLLVNLGTPLSPNPKHVFNYLNEFLTDERVIDLPWIYRQLLVRGIIVPSRFRNSAKMYEAIWQKEGSPLLIHGKKVEALLQNALGNEYLVDLAMRYQSPSIKEALLNLQRANIKNLIVIPLFPQYASATTGSVHQKVMQILSTFQVIPKTKLIDQFAGHEKYIDALFERMKEYDLSQYDHLIFSFHGLPERHLTKANPQNHCLKNPICCEELSSKNSHCYSAQCYHTAKLLANRLKLESDFYTIAFQSRLGREPWIEPYTSDVIAKRGERGDKKLLVISPSFVADCLETLYEIGIEYAHAFKSVGGEKLDLVESLNDHPKWIEALCSIVKENN